MASLIALGSYVLAYICNSGFGVYDLKPASDGRIRYSEEAGGLGLPLTILWQPALGYSAGGNQDTLGWILQPMIWIDRRFVHKSRSLINDETFDWMQKLPLGQIHPKYRDEVASYRASKDKPSSPK